MKKNLWGCLALTCALLVAQVFVTSVTAQPRVLRVNVPFAFVASEKEMPAGTYYVAWEAEHRKLVLASCNGPEMAFLMPVVTAYGTKQDDALKLRFHKYGGEYFLREIASNEGAATWTLGPAKAEKTRLKSFGYEVAEVRSQK